MNRCRFYGLFDSLSKSRVYVCVFVYLCVGFGFGLGEGHPHDRKIRHHTDRTISVCVLLFFFISSLIDDHFKSPGCLDRKTPTMRFNAHTRQEKKEKKVNHVLHKANVNIQLDCKHCWSNSNKKPTIYGVSNVEPDFFSLSLSFSCDTLWVWCKKCCYIHILLLLNEQKRIYTRPKRLNNTTCWHIWELCTLHVCRLSSVSLMLLLLLMSASFIWLELNVLTSIISADVGCKLCGTQCPI